jgi:hypothetical protein
MIPARPLKEVTYPHLLTPKALAYAEGRIVNHMQEADWIALYRYWDREKAVQAVVDMMETRLKSN